MSKKVTKIYTRSILSANGVIKNADGICMKMVLSNLCFLLVSFSLLGCGGLQDTLSLRTITPISQEDVDVGEVETDLLVGVWLLDESFNFIDPRQSFTFDDDGVFEIKWDEVGAKGIYGAVEIEEGIVRRSLLADISFFQLNTHRRLEERLVSDFYKVTLDLSGFRAGSGILVFCKEGQRLEEPLLVSRGSDSFSANIRVFSNPVSVTFDRRIFERVIGEVLKQEKTSGEIRALSSTSIGTTQRSSDLPQTIFFEIDLFTKDDFLNLFLETSYIRVERNSIREFATLELAKEDRDEDLLWAGTRK